MSNISFVYPTSGAESHLNNTFIVKDNKCKNTIIKTGEEEFVFPLVEVEEIISGINSCSIYSIRDKVDFLISNRDGENLIKEINKYEVEHEVNPSTSVYNKNIGLGYDVDSLLYSNTEITLNIQLKGYSVCIINNAFIWENSKVTLPANVIYPIRIITGSNGEFSITNLSENIFFIPKEVNE